MIFDFDDMLDDYAVDYTLTYSPGRWEDREWVEGSDENEQRNDPIIPLTNDDLQADEGGRYTREDRKLFSRVMVPIGSKIKYQGLEYEVQPGKDYGEYAGVYIYILKRVGGTGDAS